MHEEPIVRTPEEAISAFEQSKIHALAIGNFIIEVDWAKKVKT